MSAQDVWKVLIINLINLYKVIIKYDQLLLMIYFLNYLKIMINYQLLNLIIFLCKYFW